VDRGDSVWREAVFAIAEVQHADVAIAIKVGHKHSLALLL
jgi:hypothetical protein